MNKFTEDDAVTAKDLRKVVNSVKGENDVEIDGKVYKSNWFKPGNDLARESNREKAKATRLKNKELKIGMELSTYTVANVRNMKQIRHWAQTYGVSKVIEHMERMHPEDFFKAFVLLAPYLLPKVAAVDVGDSSDKVHNIDKNQGHTITVKDMSGKQVQFSTIQEEE